MWYQMSVTEKCGDLSHPALTHQFTVLLEINNQVLKDAKS